MPCPSSRRPRGGEDNARFRNYAQSVDLTVERMWKPADLRELVWIVQHAETEGKRVHAKGAGWSFEDLAATGDWMVDLENLNRVLPGLVDRGTASRPLTDRWRERQFGDGADKLVHVEAGARIFDLNHALTSRGLALPTMGGAQGQTIAGAISTSTHGSDIEQPPLCDLVQAVHLVTTGGQEVWIERSTDPLTDDDAALRSTLSACRDLDIIRDDDLLNAVVVAVGRFGVIYSFVLQVTTAFRLAEFAQQLPWRDVANALAAGVGRGPTGANPFGRLHGLLDSPPHDLRIRDSPTEYRYLDLVFNPRNRGTCWVRRRWITREASDLNVEPTSDPLCHPAGASGVVRAASTALKGYAGLVAGIPFYGWFKAAEISARAAELDAMALDPHLTGGAALAAALNAIWASQIGEELKWLVDELTQMAISGELGKSESEGRRGSNWHIAAGSQDPASIGNCYRGNSIEVIFGLDTRRYIDFIDAVLNEAGRHLHAGYMAVRFTRKSEALLSMHNVNHHLACSIEVTSLKGISGNAAWIRWVEETALRMRGRPHWGQQNALRSPQVRELYGAKLTQWRSQLNRVAGSSATFSNAYTRQRGLEPSPVRARTPKLAFASWVHGHKLKVEVEERIVRTWRAGFYCRLEGRAGTTNWLHFAVPTPVIVDGERLRAGSVLLRYRARGGALVHAVHVYDGEDLIASHDGLSGRPAEWAMERFSVPGSPPVEWGLGLSVGVRFPERGAQLEFASAGCDFLRWA